MKEKRKEHKFVVKVKTDLNRQDAEMAVLSGFGRRDPDYCEFTLLKKFPKTKGSQDHANQQGDQMPIRVTMEIIPRGDESRKFVAGVLTIANDETGNQEIGNYELKITGPVLDGDGSIMNDFWSRGRLERFERKRGWWSCVKEALNALETDYYNK